MFLTDYGHVLGWKTLDGHLVSHVPTFTKSGLTDYIIEMTVSEDEAICCFSSNIFADLLAGFPVGG